MRPDGLRSQRLNASGQVKRPAQRRHYRRPTRRTLCPAKQAEYSGSGTGRRLVLPNAHYTPSGPAKRDVICSIPGNVPIDLRSPVARVSTGVIAVTRAPMPEAPIDENRHSCAQKDDIRPYGAIIDHNRTVQAVSQSRGVECLP
jgi:hypothetical protein